MTVIMVVAGFLFCSVSAYMAGLVGSSNNPVSGITIATILFAATVLLLLLGKDADRSARSPPIMIGAVVCCAACVAGDNLQDLKAGYIVGATPWRQQVMLAIGAISCALVMAPTLNLLATAYGIGVPSRGASQPAARAAGHADGVVANGMFGGELPWTMVAIGGGIGVADHHRRRDPAQARHRSFRTPVLAVAVGIYLPLETHGADLPGRPAEPPGDAHLRQGPHGRRSREAQSRRACCSPPGLITGEALMGIFMAHSDRTSPDGPRCWRCPKSCG